jgi:hypothetical protein
LYGEHLIAFFLRQRRRQGQQCQHCQCGETRGCFLLLSEMMMRQFVLVMRQFALVMRQLALVAARGWEGSDNTDTLRDCGARTGRRVLVRHRRTTAH